MNFGLKTRVSFNARPHPGPLPRGEGETLDALTYFASCPHTRRSLRLRASSRVKPNAPELTRDGETVLPLLGERAGVRADNSAIFN